MNDMSQVIIPKSDQLNAEDFLARPLTYVIASVEIRAGTEQPVSIFMQGEPRAWRPCKSMSRVLVAAWGPDANAYVGRSVTLYCDPKVKWGGMEVGGIRVSHLSHIEREMLLQLTATKGKRAPHIVKPIILQDQGAELTLADAERDLRAAFDLDELRVAWSRKAMQPFRDQLQPLLDERKKALSPAIQSDPATPHGEATGPANPEDEQSASSEGRSDADFGDQFDGSVTLESAKARINALRGA